MFFVHWEPVLRVEYETVILYEGRWQYRISQFEANTTEIYVSRVDAENRVIEDPDRPPKVFKFQQKLFDFSKTNREKIANRVKTILVFQ